MSAAIYYRPPILKQIRQSRHAVIEASAGTGKTFAIEHLVIDLLLSGECAVDQILLVTFTEKATAELRMRVRQALQNIAFSASNPRPAGDCEEVVIDQGGCQLLQDAFYSFDRAAIFTIHGFCNRVLTDFAFHSGTLLDLQLTDSRGAFHHAFRNDLREHLADDGVTRPLLERWLTGMDPDQPQGKTPDALEQLLFDAYQRRYLDSSDSDARLRAAQRLLDGYNGERLTPSYRSSGLKGDALKEALDSISDLGRRIAQSGGSGEQLLDSLAQFDAESLVRPVLRPYRREVGLKFSAAATKFATDLESATVMARSHEWKLVDLFLPPVAERLRRDKRERGLIDYDDMLAWVARALDGPGGGALAAALRERYRCALVDEFQDTDDLQWRIFRRLFVNSETGNRLYVVGDPKQAIYAFRGADVFTYLKARDELTTAANPPVQLIDNFRSTSELIRACNHIFDQKAPDPLFHGEIKYDHPVRCGRADRKATDSAGNTITPVVLMRYQRADGEAASVSEVRRAIGQHVAGELRSILSEDAHRIFVEDQDSERRAVKAKRIFVLTRTRQESAEAGEYLREAGVPFAFYKQEGLFQTSEAYHILDVLRAVAEPHIRSNRLKAWVTPFFAIPLRDIALIEDVSPAHPLNERLYEWKAIAERGQFAQLFDRLLHDSGLVNREVFLAGERQLTNYLHIFETLLAAALARRLALPEIIALLEDYIFERALPEVEDANIQRLESERDAVSVITVHMSKGLEADVVVLFGGFGRIQDRRDVFVYHDESGGPRIAIGKSAKEPIKDWLRREEQDEDRRLLYVGLTRARARLYLPLLPKDSTKIKINGYYAALNQRLLAIEAGRRDRAVSKLFAVQNVPEPSQTDRGGADVYRRVGAWTPPPAFLDDRKDTEHESSLWRLRHRRAPLVMRSYTSLHGVEEEQRWDIPAEDFKGDLETASDQRDLPGGREVGIFLHQVIEQIAMGSFAESPELCPWRERDDVKGHFYAAMRRNGVKDQKAWFERGTQLVFNALTTPISIPDGRTVGPLCRCRSVREMEFVYPIPESSHPLLAAGAAAGEWTVERGYLKGFVDFIFEHDSRIFFADWKSDQLPSYETAAIEVHVHNHYRLQAQIYSIGVIRLLQIRNEDDYERRFGGLLYIFLRGINSNGRNGVYFHRPEWSEICAYEGELMRIETGSVA